MTRSLASPAVLSAVLGIAACAGCAKFQVPAKLPWTEAEPEIVAPDKMEVVWTNATLHQAGKPSTRGFGGRVIFHAKAQDDPVLVDGKLTVFAFANEDPLAGDSPPEKKFVFPQDSFSSHQSPSMLGPSYSFWLPWDEVRGSQRQLSLIARYEDASGKVVMSEIAHVTLPGRKPEANVDAVSRLPDDPYPVRQASHRNATEPDPRLPSSDLPRTTTIHVTPGFARKLLSPTTSGEQKPNASPANEIPGVTSADLAPVADSIHQDDAPSASKSTHAAPRTKSIRREPHRAESIRRLPPTPRTGWRRNLSEDDEPSDSES